MSMPGTDERMLPDLIPKVEQILRSRFRIDHLELVDDDGIFGFMVSPDFDGPVDHPTAGLCSIGSSAIPSSDLTDRERRRIELIMTRTPVEYQAKLELDASGQPLRSLPGSFERRRIVEDEHAQTGPRLDPRTRRRDRAAAAQLRASPGAARDGRGGGPRHRAARPPDRRGGDGRRQELRLPGPGDPGHGRPQEEGRRLDAHHRAPGAIAPQGHPVPPLGDAAGVLGGPGQGAVELHQPAAARRGDQAAGPAVPEARGDRPARHAADVVEPDHGRQPLRPGLPPDAQRLGGRAERGRQLPGPRVPDVTPSASSSRPGGGCARPTCWWSTTRCSSPTWRCGPTATACCPSTRSPSSTRRTRSRPSPASTWACSSRASGSTTPWRGCTTRGPAGACWRRIARRWTRRSSRRRRRGRRPRTSSTGPPPGIRASPTASTAGSASPSAGASISARSCAGSPAPSIAAPRRSRSPRTRSS